MRALPLAAFLGFSAIAAHAAPLPEPQNAHIMPVFSSSEESLAVKNTATCGVDLIAALAIPAEHLMGSHGVSDSGMALACIKS